MTTIGIRVSVMYILFKEVIWRQLHGKGLKKLKVTPKPNKNKTDFSFETDGDPQTAIKNLADITGIHCFEIKA